MSFSQMNLDPSISKAISACGYTTPTPVQLQTIPIIMQGEDLIACAPTGTGKTAAFVLPALNRITRPMAIRKPRVLVLTPTRELAEQITKSAGKYGKFMRFNMTSLVGGMPYRQQLRDLSRTADLVVATPGRLLDHMENRRIDLSGIEMLVLDEADRMLDMGFIDDVQTIAKATPHQRQTLLFSATVDGKLGQVIKNLLKNPASVDLSEENLSPAQITQELYLADNPQHKARLLQHFLDEGNIFKGIIFTATKMGADKLAGELNHQGYAAAALHGDLRQSQRNRTLEQMRRGKIQFLVATDVAARGIDISDMTHVINYDLPRFCEDYVHRIGRTGRAGKTGIAISFALQSDAMHVQRIEKYIGEKLTILMVNGLEPANKHFNPNPPKKGRRRKPAFGGKSSRQSKSSFGDRRSSDNGKSAFGGDRERAKPARGKSSGNSFEARGSDRSKAKFGDKRSERSESDRGQSRFGSSDRTESSRGRPSFDRPARAESGRSRPNPTGGRSGRNESRSKMSFDRSERTESNRSRSSFSRSERTESSRGKSASNGGRSSSRTESGRERSNFSRPERSASPDRGNFSKAKPARKKPEFAKESASGVKKRAKVAYKTKKD